MKIFQQSRSNTNTDELDLACIKGDLRSFIEQSQEGHRDTKDLVSIESLNIRTHISSVSTKTNKALGRVQQSLDSLVLDTGVQVTQAKRERLLQSLKYPGFNERRNQVSEAYKSTGSWIFAGDGEGVDGVEDGVVPHADDTSSATAESKESSHCCRGDLSTIKWDSFSNWLRSTDTFYWISGKPGSGKTTLVKSILEHPNTRAYLDIWQPGSLIISHFFWRPGTQLQQNIKGLLCSLLHQLLHNGSTAVEFGLSSHQNSSTKDADTA